jgi:tetratricopeptide (TPR) repeat protein
MRHTGRFTVLMCGAAIGMLGASPPQQGSQPTKKMSIEELHDWIFVNNRAWDALRNGQYSQAEQRFRYAIKIAAKYEKQNPRLLARSYHDLALTLHEEGRYAEAEPLAKWALSVREYYEASDSTPLAQSLNTVAGIEVALNNRPEAEQYYRRAIQVWEEAVGPEHPNAAGSYYDLAAVLARRRKFSEADSYFRRAGLIFSEGRRPDYRSLAQTLLARADMKVTQGLDDQAEPLFKEIVDLYELKSLSDRDPVLVEALQHYASLLRREHHPAQAEDIENRLKVIHQAAR